MPLANVTLLDYTLHFLVNAGVQEIFVMCKVCAVTVYCDCVL